MAVPPAPARPPQPPSHEKMTFSLNISFSLIFPVKYLKVDAEPSLSPSLPPISLFKSSLNRGSLVCSLHVCKLFAIMKGKACIFQACCPGVVATLPLILRCVACVGQLVGLRRTELKCFTLGEASQLRCIMDSYHGFHSVTYSDLHIHTIPSLKLSAATVGFEIPPEGAAHVLVTMGLDTSISWECLWFLYSL